MTLLRNLGLILATLLIAAMALVSPSPAGAAGSPTRYAYGLDTTPTTVHVVNQWKRGAQVTDAVTGVSGHVNSLGASTDLTEPVQPCTLNLFWVQWNDGYTGHYYWPVGCGTPTAQQRSTP